MMYITKYPIQALELLNISYTLFYITTRWIIPLHPRLLLFLLLLNPEGELAALTYIVYVPSVFLFLLLPLPFLLLVVFPPLVLVLSHLHLHHPRCHSHPTPYAATHSALASR
jgi:hypothetical protein